MEMPIQENICVIGAGYVGLTLGLALCDVGCRVTATDKNRELIRTLSQGKSHFYERGIDVMAGTFEDAITEARRRIEGRQPEPEPPVQQWLPLEDPE